MANTVFNAHKPARELPISRSTSKLLEEVDKQLKNLTTDVRHTYGREFIMLLLEMRRLIRKANAAQTLEEKAERIAEFIDAYDDLADLLKLKTDVGDFPKPAHIQLLIPLGSVSKQAHGMAFIGFYIKDGRIYTGNRTISHLYDLIRLQRDAEDKAFHVECFARRYNSLAGFLVHTYSYNIRCCAWYSIDQETKTYLEEPGWDFKKIQPLNQYTSITKIKNLYYAQSRFAKRRVG